MDDSDQSILNWRVRVPEHVVYRDFPEETVILNLETGMYHGLNPTAARMLVVLQEKASVRDALPELVQEFAQPQSVIERDVESLCRNLSERGLIMGVDDSA